ncbi:MAG: hypothetical protein AAFS07_17555 [Pseudomonadota bacterium]
MRIRPAAALALLTLAVAAPAQGQGLGGVLEQTGLEKEDRALMTAAAASLYTAEAPAIGDETIWKNQATGAHGTVEITAFDGSCVGLRHLFMARGRTEADRFDSRRCKDESGDWKLALE